MCGRFSLLNTKEEIEQTFKVSFADLDYQPRLNIAPHQGILTICLNHQGNQETSRMYWGFIPFWTKDFHTAHKSINARSETLHIKPYFRQAFKTGRCLIPATSFYEWEKTPQAKIPYRFFMPNHKLFAFAGLWNTWQDKEGTLLNTCTIITTSANQKVEWLHDRMPVILQDKEWHPWLQGTLNTFASFANYELEFENASLEINNPRYEPYLANPL